MPSSRLHQPKKVVIFGTGSFAQVAYVYLREDSPHEVVAFTVDAEYCRDPQFMGKDLVAFEQVENTYPPSDFAMLVAVGFRRVNKLREELYHRCKEKGYELITYINSRATHFGEFEIGDNCFVFEENVIQPFVTIGNNVILWSGNHLGHHSRIGDHCFISSHAVISGFVEIGTHCFLGVNTTFRDKVKVGNRCVIGAGANVMRDTRDDAVLRVKSTPPSRLKSSELRAFK